MHAPESGKGCDKLPRIPLRCIQATGTAHNKDVTTFDNMVSALQYHMHQHVVITDIGEFGGSTIQASFKQPFDRLISHSHGSNQISISTADIDLAAFKRKLHNYVDWS